MTTTAHEDQFTDAQEPVRQMYSIVDILRRNVADLEIALLKQTERAEKAEEELKELREQVPLTFVHDPNGYAIGGTHTEIADALPVGTDLYTRPIPAPAVPEEWRNIVTEMLGWWDAPAMTMSQGKVIAEKARDLLQSASTGEPK